MKRCSAALLAALLVGFCLTSCRSTVAANYAPAPMRFQGVKKVTVDVTVMDTGTGYSVDARDDDSDGNGKDKEHKLVERAGFLEWKFAGAPIGGLVEFKFPAQPGYNFSCTLDQNRRCASNTFNIPCDSDVQEYRLKYDIHFSHNGKTGVEDPWVVIEK